MLGERLGAGFPTCSCFRASELLERGGGVEGGRRVLSEGAGEMVGVVKGESAREGLRGGVGVSCCEAKPESLEMRF